MIITEARFRVVVKIPKEVDADQFIDLVWERSQNDIENIEHSIVSDGIEVYLFPTCDIRVQPARMIERLALEVAVDMGFNLLHIPRR